MDILAVLQQFINIKAVLAAVVLTQMVKYWLPSPTVDRTMQVIPGHLTTRLLPMVPVLIGFIVTYFLEKDSRYTVDDAFRGCMSGMFAAFTYRTTKVAIFGE